MRTETRTKVTFIALAAAIGAFGFMGRDAQAHCDTLDGPVVVDARKAIAEKKVDRVLKWVTPDDEAEVRATFNRVLAVRGESDQGAALADQFFFESVVRIHRAAEGEPFTGLKSAGMPAEPGIEAADKALERGSEKELAGALSTAISEEISRRFKDASEKRKHADESVEAGRAYVEAYVAYIHYVEALEQLVHGNTAHSDHSGGKPETQTEHDKHVGAPAKGEE